VDLIVDLDPDEVEKVLGVLFEALTKISAPK
jgi:hypothetical protein